MNNLYKEKINRVKAFKKEYKSQLNIDNISYLIKAGIMRDYGSYVDLSNLYSKLDNDRFLLELKGKVNDDTARKLLACKDLQVKFDKYGRSILYDPYDLKNTEFATINASISNEEFARESILSYSFEPEILKNIDRETFNIVGKYLE